MTQVFRILVGIVPVYEGKVLLLQRSLREKFMPGAWGIPAGKIDFGEDLEAAVLRELHEESGLTATIEKMTGVSKFMSIKDSDELHNLQVNFLVIADSDNVTLDHSSDDFRWIELDDIDQFGLDVFTKATIRQATSV